MPCNALTRTTQTRPALARACLAPRLAPRLALGLASGLAVAATAARADGYVMGAGRWSCAVVAEAVASGDAAQVDQAAGWVLGWWSAATFRRETRFVDIVEEVGGGAIWDKTVAECRNAPPDTLLYLVVDSMISNTK